MDLLTYTISNMTYIYTEQLYMSCFIHKNIACNGFLFFTFYTTVVSVGSVLYSTSGL